MTLAVTDLLPCNNLSTVSLDLELKSANDPQIVSGVFKCSIKEKQSKRPTTEKHYND